MSEGGVEWEIGIQYQSTVVKRELSMKAKLSIYRLIYVPALTYSHELWVMTKRIKTWKQAEKISFLQRESALKRELFSTHKHQKEPAEEVHLLNRMLPGRLLKLFRP